MIIYLPFENLPQRYTKMWNDAIVKELQNEDATIIDCDKSEKRIINGEFLDTNHTTEFKFRELIEVSKLFAQNKIKSGDVFFVPDTWFFGLSAIRYMAELSEIKIKVVSFNHAGRADEDDFVQKLGDWADTQEQAWTDMCDLILVGSQYHKTRVEKKFHPKKVIISGAVWSKEWMDNFTADIQREKEDYIIYPHRLCEEKQYKLFKEVAIANPSLRFVVTTGGDSRLKDELPSNVEYRYGLTKKEYFQIFARARGYLSTAKQETFGYTLQEAIYFGCQVIVPDYACYGEYAHHSSIFTFDQMRQKGFLTECYNRLDLKQSSQFQDNAKYIIEQLKKV